MVALAYRNLKKPEICFSMLSLVAFGVLCQAIVTYFQYREKPAKERILSLMAALLGLAPLHQGYNVWTGHVDDESIGDLLVPPPVLFGVLKGLEIAIECIPESVLQTGAILSLSREELAAEETQLSLLLVGMFSTFLGASYIMMDANFTMMKSKRISNPGDRFYRWIPWDSTKHNLCKVGMTAFNLGYMFQVRSDEERNAELRTRETADVMSEVTKR